MNHNSCGRTINSKCFKLKRTQFLLTKKSRTRAFRQTGSRGSSDVVMTQFHFHHLLILFFYMLTYF